MSNADILINISNQTIEHETEFITVGQDGKDKKLVYIIDNFKYTGVGKEGNLSWDYEELSINTFEINWNLNSPLDHFKDLMADEVPGQNIDVTWKQAKDESLDGKTYYVLQSEKITNFTDPKYTGYHLDETYHTFWIDKTNNLLDKVQLNQILEITGDFAGDDDKRYLTSEFIFTFYDYNIPVIIELPPEAIP
jgi:hypothetical protein